MLLEEVRVGTFVFCELNNSLPLFRRKQLRCFAAQIERDEIDVLRSINFVEFWRDQKIVYLYFPEAACKSVTSTNTGMVLKIAYAFKEIKHLIPGWHSYPAFPDEDHF